MTEEEKIKKAAQEMAGLIHRNIRDVVTALTTNIDMSKPHTVLSAFAGVYSVSSYFEYKLTELGLSPEAIQIAKEKSEKYVIDIISSDLDAFSIEKGEA